MTRRLALFLAVAIGVLAVPSSAAALTQLGIAPWKECGGSFQGGVSGCVASEPMAMDDTSVGNVNISPHVIRAGETLTIGAEWLPGWDITGFNPPGQVISGCGAGDHSCTVKLTSPTGGYVRHQLNFCCFNAREQDYYAVIGEDEWVIEGTVMDRFGPRQELRAAAFTGVTATLDGKVFSTTTNKFGQYELPVEAGSGTIRTAEKQCVKAELPKCNTSKSVTVGPNQHVDFEAPPPGKIKGAVKDEEGNPEAGVTIRADDPEGGRLDTAVSDENGLYELTARAGDVHLSADDPQACAVSAGEECPKTKDIDLTADQTAVVDWKVEGCVKKVDFGSSMVAVRGCFTKVEDEKWETDEKFTMDGLDLYPGGKVTLDKQARRVSFGGGGEVKLGNDTKVKIPSFDLDFPSSETKYELTALDNKGKSVEGFDVANKMDLKFEAGKTTVVMETKTDTGFGKSYPEQRCKGTASTLLSLTQTNDDGFRSANFEAKGLKEVFCLPGLSRFAGPVAVDSVKGSFDFKTHWWSVGGSLVKVGPFSGVLAGPKATAEFTIDNRLQLKGGSLAVDGLNLLLEPPLLHLQRLGLKFGQTNEGEPFKTEASIGASVGPKIPGGSKELNIPLLGKFVIKPEELTSLDLSFGGSVAEGDHPASLDDLTLSGNGKVKFWDQQVLEGSAKLIIPSASFAFSGKVDFKAGNVLALHGDGKSWVDTVNGVFFAEAFGQINVLGWRATQGNFLLNSSTPIVAACQRNSSGYEYGVSYNFKGEAPKLAGCDLGPYRATPPKGARIASVAGTSAAAKSKAFTVAKGVPMMALEVKGDGPSGAPVVKLSGPSGTFTTEAIKPSEGKFARALPNGAEKSTYVLLNAPKAGRWKVTAQAGSSIASLGFARPLPEPVVSGTTSGDSCAPTLRWALKRQPGQTVMLVDEGEAGDTRILNKAAKAKGALKLTAPTPGVRTVSAVVLQGGGPRETIPLATYGGPGSPSGLKVKRAKKGLTLSWRASCGVSSYAVKVGKGKPRIVSGASVTIAKAPKKATVTVTSLVDGTAIGTASRPLAPGTS